MIKKGIKEIIHKKFTSRLLNDSIFHLKFKDNTLFELDDVINGFATYETLGKDKVYKVFRVLTGI